MRSIDLVLDRVRHCHIDLRRPALVLGDQYVRIEIPLSGFAENISGLQSERRAISVKRLKSLTTQMTLSQLLENSIIEPEACRRILEPPGPDVYALVRASFKKTEFNKIIASSAEILRVMPSRSLSQLYLLVSDAPALRGDIEFYRTQEDARWVTYFDDFIVAITLFLRPSVQTIKMNIYQSSLIMLEADGPRVWISAIAITTSNPYDLISKKSIV